MSMQLGPMEICCDAPPYNIVQACTQLGFHNPEDVRWSRTGRQGGFGQLALEAIRVAGGRGTTQCVCGQRMPLLQRYLFLLLNGKELTYLLGQCERCRTIFWEGA
jgi:hypothetical protein